jgi:hypothetical protein
VDGETPSDADVSEYTDDIIFLGINKNYDDKLHQISKKFWNKSKELVKKCCSCRQRKRRGGMLHILCLRIIRRLQDVSVIVLLNVANIGAHFPTSATTKLKQITGDSQDI